MPGLRGLRPIDCVRYVVQIIMVYWYRQFLLIGVMMVPKKRDIVQVKNPRTGHYVKIDRSLGRIIDHKKSSGPYSNIPIARKPSGGTKK